MLGSAPGDAEHPAAVVPRGKGPLLDTVIIAQYQRTTHYGSAGFGTAATYAEALGKSDDAMKLNQATKEIYSGDEYMTKPSEFVNAKADDE